MMMRHNDAIPPGGPAPAMGDHGHEPLARLFFFFPGCPSSGPSPGQHPVDRKDDLDRGALFRLAGDLESGAIGLGKGLGQRQAKPGAADFRVVAVMDAAEGREGDLQRLGRNADAGVLDPEDEFACRAGLAGDDDLTAGSGEFDRIGNEIEQDLLHRSQIGDDIGQAGGEIAPQDDPAGARLLLHQLEAVLGQLAEIDRGEIELELAGLDLGQVEKIVDERQQMLARSVDVVGIGRDIWDCASRRSAPSA